MRLGRLASQYIWYWGIYFKLSQRESKQNKENQKVDTKNKFQFICKPWLRKLNYQRNFVECDKRVLAKK